MIKREELIKYIGENFNTSKKSGLFISNKPVNINNICNHSGKVFNNVEENSVGWLLFHDKVNGANWGHDCEYFFIIDKDKFYNKQSNFPPKNVKMEEILGKNIYVFKNVYDNCLYTNIACENEIEDLDKFILDNKNKNIVLVENKKYSKKQKFKILSLKNKK